MLWRAPEGAIREASKRTVGSVTGNEPELGSIELRAHFCAAMLDRELTIGSYAPQFSLNDQCLNAARNAENVYMQCLQC